MANEQKPQRSENLVEAHYNPETGVASVVYKPNGHQWRGQGQQRGNPSQAFLIAFRRATNLLIVGEGFRLTRDGVTQETISIGGTRYEGFALGGKPECYAEAYAQALDQYYANMQRG